MIEKGEEARSSAVKMKIRAKKQTAKEKNGGISRKIKGLRRDVAARLKQKFVKNVVQDLTSGGIDWQREKWQSGLGSKFIHQGEKNAVKYADDGIIDYKELWIDRRENSKSLAWSSVLLALGNIKKVGEVVERPKALGDIRGVTYIYGMFYRFGLIDMPKEVKEKKNDRGNKKQKKGREDMLEENIKFFRRL